MIEGGREGEETLDLPLEGGLAGEAMSERQGLVRLEPHGPAQVLEGGGEREGSGWETSGDVLVHRPECKGCGVG